MSPLAIALSTYLVASLLAFSAFLLDKRRATRGRTRIRESSLHALELLGGWPGALLAMRVVRHKRRKPSYWLVTVAIAGLHLAAWVALLVWLPGA